MPWWPGAVLVLAGVYVFAFLSHDFGQRFVWPGIIIAAIGMAMLGGKLLAAIVYNLSRC